MSQLFPSIDPDGFLEYSVVYTDRALNHMSAQFIGVMKDISRVLKTVYNAHSALVMPGSGSFAMEAVARQFAQDKKCLIIRNGWFSYRWSQIFDMGKIASESLVLKARTVKDSAQKAHQQAFSPAPILDVVETILREKPALIFAPHVETASGIILPDDYLAAIGKVAHEIGALFILDCVASGNIWVDMQKCRVDVLISAPQKGWSSSPCCGLVALSERARKAIDATTSSSFSCDLKKWLQMMETFESGAHAYHATLPTDSLLKLRDTMLEIEQFGFANMAEAQWTLGQKIRAVLEEKGFPSVAAKGFQAPGVVVSYTDDAEIASTKKFAQVGVQSASGVPLQCDESADFRTFRLGLFGLEKLKNIDRTVETIKKALAAIV